MTYITADLSFVSQHFSRALSPENPGKHLFRQFLNLIKSILHKRHIGHPTQWLSPRAESSPHLHHRNGQNYTKYNTGSIWLIYITTTPVMSVPENIILNIWTLENTIRIRNVVTQFMGNLW